MTIGTIVGVIAIVLITIVIGILIDRKYRIVPRPSDLAPAERRKPATAHAAGEAPATAIRARTGQLDKLRVRRCPACRAEMTSEPDDRVRYNDSELLVLHFACPACAAKRSLYVQPVE